MTSAPPAVDSVLHAIGQTPLLRLHHIVLGPGKVVATVAVDTGLKYLAGDLFK